MTIDLAGQRRAIRHLIDEQEPKEAMNAYYAFYHDDQKTTLMIEPDRAARADGYLALSRTGIDLFRPLVTMHLPADLMGSATDLIYRALPPEAAVILTLSEQQMPLIRALFSIQSEERLRLLVLEPSRFEPIVNVLLTQSDSPNGLPRFAIRQQGQGGDVAASAGLNWQSPRFADVAVTTNPRYRRQGYGRSVVAAVVQHVLANGRLPIYHVSENNDASYRLAQSVGFRDTNHQLLLVQATLNQRP